MLTFPKDPRKLRERIRRYERAFVKEKAAHGMIRDGAGKRFLLAPLYLMAGDLDGAAKSFRWYADEFPDDMPNPGHRLCWALTLFRNGENRDAVRRLGQSMLANLYLLPRLLNQAMERLDIWYGSNLAWPEYVDSLPVEYFQIWTPAELVWARQAFESDAFQTIRVRYIDIQSKLRDMPSGPRRTQLASEMNKLKGFGFGHSFDSSEVTS